MNATQPFIFAQFPNELICEIFEHAAASDLPTALSLSRVSSWVNHLVEPLVYHTVVLSTARSVTSFISALAQKPATFAPKRVKHLGIFALGPVQAIDQAIDACRGVDSLACGFYLPGYKQLHGSATLQSLACPREQHFLGLACRDGWDISLVGPSVTHLRVHLSAEQTKSLSAVTPGEQFVLNGSGWERLCALPTLTHLAIVFRPSPSYAITSILAPILALLAPEQPEGNARAAPMQKLRLVLIQVTGSVSSQRAAVEALNAEVTAHGGDALRVVAESAPSSAASQWEDAVRGGKGVWEDAEEVVRARLAGRK